MVSIDAVIDDGWVPKALTCFFFSIPLQKGIFGKNENTKLMEIWRDINKDCAIRLNRTIHTNRII